jgi:hypothetical protein
MVTHVTQPRVTYLDEPRVLRADGNGKPMRGQPSALKRARRHDLLINANALSPFRDPHNRIVGRSVV